MRDWESEWWVRLYIRDEPDWLVLPWWVRGLFDELMKRVDSAGVMYLGSVGRKAIAASLNAVWDDMLADAIEKLLQNGAIRLLHGESYLYIPNFVQAQSARQNEALRSRRKRDRAKAFSRLPSITECDATDTDRVGDTVTDRGMRATDSGEIDTPRGGTLPLPIDTNCGGGDTGDGGSPQDVSVASHLENRRHKTLSVVLPLSRPETGPVAPQSGPNSPQTVSVAPTTRETRIKAAARTRARESEEGRSAPAASKNNEAEEFGRERFGGKTAATIRALGLTTDQVRFAQREYLDRYPEPAEHEDGAFAGFLRTMRFEPESRPSYCQPFPEEKPFTAKDRRESIEAAELAMKDLVLGPNTPTKVPSGAMAATTTVGPTRTGSDE